MAYVIRSALAQKESLSTLRVKPELRKATEQMLWAYSAASKCLGGIANRDHMGLVLGSGQGELETTKEYYKFLALENTPRPFLFQNSLHHSTTGMLSLSLHIRGPAATVSDCFFSGESAIELAISFLEAHLCNTCLVVGVDTLVPDFSPGVRGRYPQGFELAEGSAAILLANSDGLKESGQRAELEIQSLKLSRDEKSEIENFTGHYDSNGIARLIEFNQEGNELRLDKPDGSASYFLLRRY